MIQLFQSKGRVENSHAPKILEASPWLCVEGWDSSGWKDERPRANRPPCKAASHLDLEELVWFDLIQSLLILPSNYARGEHFSEPYEVDLRQEARELFWLGFCHSTIKLVAAVKQQIWARVEAKRWLSGSGLELGLWWAGWDVHVETNYLLPWLGEMCSQQNAWPDFSNT